MIIFSLFHSPGDRGWFYFLLLDLDWKSLRFTRLTPRACIATGAVGVGPVRSTRGITVSVSDSFRD